MDAADDPVALRVETEVPTLSHALLAMTNQYLDATPEGSNVVVTELIMALAAFTLEHEALAEPGVAEANIIRDFPIVMALLRANSGDILKTFTDMAERQQQTQRPQ